MKPTVLLAGKHHTLLLPTGFYLLLCCLLVNLLPLSSPLSFYLLYSAANGVASKEMINTSIMAAGFVINNMINMGEGGSGLQQDGETMMTLTTR